MFLLVRGPFGVLLLLPFTPEARDLSQGVDSGTAVARNGDGPLVDREPSAEDRTSPTKEKLMSIGERTGPGLDPEPPNAPSPSQWTARIRRARNEVALHVLRGAATAIGGSLVAYGAVWLHNR